MTADKNQSLPAGSDEKLDPEAFEEVEKAFPGHVLIPKGLLAGLQTDREKLKALMESKIASGEICPRCEAPPVLDLRKVHKCARCRSERLKPRKAVRRN